MRASRPSGRIRSRTFPEAANNVSSQNHSYFDWQVSTMMLAYDAVEPLGRHDEAALARRQQQVEEELHRMVHEVIPEDYRVNPEREFQAEVVVMLTRATIRRAAEIVGLDCPDSQSGG